MALSDNQIANIVKSEEQNALDYENEIAKKRAKNLDYYNMQPYGDEVAGQSSAITSDVSDVIEWMIPSLMRTFTQGKLIGHFEAPNAQYEDEAKEKTALSNYVFLKENNGVMILHNMFKDALLQYTGTVKVCWNESEEPRKTRYEGLSDMELAKLRTTPGVEVEEFESVETELGTVYNASSVEIVNTGKVDVINIPPEEFLISKEARDFIDPIFIGHRSPKTRSDLIGMGFDADMVNSLPADEYYELSEQKNARYHDYSFQDGNPSHHTPNDIIYLGEYYVKMDVDDDGITELWQVMFAGNQVLSKEQVEEHPFAVAVPIPIPHRAIGSCPAEQVCDIQYRKSVLLRNGLDNVYQTNYPRVLHSNKVDLDDLFTPRAGGGISVDSSAPDVSGHAVPFVVPQQVDGVMRMIEYTDMEREIRTGITRYSQGLDGEALNKTATGFKGIMDASQQRLDLITRLFAESVKVVFEKIVNVLSKYQDTTKQIQIMGQPMEIDPRMWGQNIYCRVDVGIGSGDRQEKILNLNNILTIQERFMASGMILADQEKIYKTLEKMIDEVGLKDVEQYFNNPEIPEETLMATVQILNQENAVLKEQAAQNPLAEAEMIKAQAKLAEVQGKESNSMRQFIMKMAQEDKEFMANYRLELEKLGIDLTELELKYDEDVPGSKI